MEFAKFRQVYGDEAAGRLLTWLEGLAAEEKLSVEFDPEMWLEFSKELGKYWNKWLQSGIVDKVRALLYVRRESGRFSRTASETQAGSL